MKFTKLALASVAAFGLAGAAMADDFAGVADGLDTWEAGASPSTGYGAGGAIDSGGANAVWFGVASEQVDTVFTTYTDSGVAPYSGDTSRLPGGISTGSNYLKVSNSKPIWRVINPYAFDVENLPTEFPAESVEVSTGLYVDTLVQFTPSEDAPSVETDSKLIVWMNAESNLCVTANLLSLDDGSLTNWNFQTSKRLEVATWYRLTVKAYDTVLDKDGTSVHGFEVFIDGSVVSSAAASINVASPQAEEYISEWSEALADDMLAGKVFFSLDTTSSSATLSAVGFKGEGMVDNIVVTDVDPLPGSADGIDFTLTWGADVSAVWYAIAGKTNDYTSAVSVDSGTEVTYGGTPTDTTGWLAVAPVTITVTEATNCTVVATTAATAGAAGVTGDLAGFKPAELQAVFGSSATPALINADTYAYYNYQFGQTLGTIQSVPTLKISDIVQDGETWKVKVQVLADQTSGESTVKGPVTLEKASGESHESVLKATLKVKQSATLAGLDSAEASDYSFSTTVSADGTTTDLTVTITGGSFFKAYIDYATPAVQ